MPATIHYDNRYPSIKPFMKTSLRGPGSERLTNIQHLESQLNLVNSELNQRQKKSYFDSLIQSLYSLVAKRVIRNNNRFDVSLSEWQNDMTNAVNRVTNELRKFVIKILESSDSKQLVAPKAQELRDFAGLNSGNRPILES